MGYIPNIFTLLNLTFGVLSLLYAVHQDYLAAAIFILVAALLDGVDGRIARRLHVSSELGKQLDSLSDLVSFGVAPAMLIYLSIFYPNYGAFWSMLLTVVYVLCGAFRLARFNTVNIQNYFIGIPITIAGGMVALLSLFDSCLSPGFFLILMPLLSYLMVSSIKVPKM